MTPSGPERPAGSDAAPQGESPPAGRRGEDGGQLSGMARGGGLNLVGALFNQSALFAITALLAIPLGKTDVGRYATSYALLSILGLLSLVGFRAAMTRFVAVHLADEDWARVRGTIRLGLLMSLGSSLVLGAVVVAASGWIAGVYDDPALRVPLILTGCTLPAATLADAALAATQGWRTQRPFTYIGRILDPGLRLVLTGGLLLAGAGLVGAMVALLVASWVAAAGRDVGAVAARAPGARRAAGLRRPGHLLVLDGELGLRARLDRAHLGRHAHPRLLPQRRRGGHLQRLDADRHPRRLRHGPDQRRLRAGVRPRLPRR